MNFFEKIINRLFPVEDEITVHEIMKRSPGFIKKYQEWILSVNHKSLMNDLRKSIFDKNRGLKPIVGMEIFQSKYANGILISPGDALPFEYLVFLMEHIKDRLIAWNYRLVQSDRKINEKDNNVHSIEKYYLKPPLSSGKPIDQHFGNIIIELILVNNTAIKLKTIANIYSDRMYNDPRKFEDLISLLFNSSSVI